MTIHAHNGPPKPKKSIFRDVKSDAIEPLAIGPNALGFMFECSDECDTEIVDGVAVVSIEGPLEHKRCWFWDSYEAIADRFHTALSDENVSSIVLKIDSPGGDCSGLVETVRALRAMKERFGKPVYAYADEGAYSAAYAIATIADEIYLPQSGGVGSIGVIHTLCDRVGMNDQLGVNVAVITSGEQKADGHPDIALSKGALARAQARVNGLAGLLFQVVSEARALSPESIASLQAGCFYGDQAVKVGLADGVLSFSDVVATARGIATGDQPMSKVLLATKAVNEARAALAAAKSDEDRKSAARALRDAEKALASETTVTTTTETETATDDPEDKEGDDDEEDDDKKSDDDDAEMDGDDEDCEEPGEAAAASAKDVLALCRKLTGKKSASEIVGALQAMSHSRAQVAELSAKVERLERANRHTQVDALVASASKAGKIPRGLESWAKELGRKSLKSLKAYIEVAPKVVATLEDGGAREPAPGANGDGLTTDEIKIAARLGISVDKLAATKKQIALTQASGKHGLIVH